MQGRGLWALAAIVAGLAAGGCVGEAPLRPTPAVPVPTGPPQDGAGAVTLSTPGVTRSQKPEGTPPPPATAPPPGAAAAPTVSVRATINGEAILDDEIRATAGSALLLARTPAEQAEVYEQALDQIVDREVVVQEAVSRLAKGPQGVKLLDKIKEEASKDFQQTYVRRIIKGNHLSGEDELKAFLREHDVSFDLMKRTWERQFIAMQYLSFRISPYIARIGHAELVEYYDKHPEDFQVADGVEWQDLFVDAAEHASRKEARAFAESLADRARRGEDFAALAKQYDRGDSRLREFKGVGKSHGEVRPPEAEPVLFRLKDGETAVVEIRSGFHVVHLVHRDYAHRRPFDEKVQKQIKEKLRAEVFSRETKRIVADLKRKAVIEKYPQ
jgi:hypothetical protein